MLRCLVLIALMAVPVAGILAQTAAQPQVLPDSEIRKVLADRIDTRHEGVGIVVGVTEPQGRRVIAYGSLAKGDQRPLNGDTVFEIGSITKAFTGLLLADMVQRGEVALTDPVAKYLPPAAKMPQRGGKQITLQDLSLQVSGLPRLPSNFAPKNPQNPYVDYTPDLLYRFLSGYSLPRDIGAEWEYSNLGIGLLGHALALRAGMDYEALVRARILAPLEMKSSGMALSPELKARLAVGHNAQKEPVSNWDFDALAGCGALRSTANDMLAFLSANLGYTESRLAPAMAAMLKVRHATGASGLEQALGWQISNKSGNEIAWKDGGTYGYGTFVGFDAKNRIGVVVLANSFPVPSANDIGLRLLDTKNSQSLLQTHQQITVSPKLFDRYAGVYQLAPKLNLNVSRDGEHLYLQVTGQGKNELFPESERDFFLKVVDAQVTFVTDGQGTATAVVLHQSGLDQRAPRIVGEVPKTKEHKQVTVDAKVLEGYVGRYQIAPAFVIAVTHEEGKMFVQATGQPKIEIFPEGERDFFLQVVDAQITFETDAQGRARALILHQGGADQRAARVE